MISYDILINVNTCPGHDMYMYIYIYISIHKCLVFSLKISKYVLSMARSVSKVIMVYRFLCSCCLWDVVYYINNVTNLFIKYYNNLCHIYMPNWYSCYSHGLFFIQINWMISDVFTYIWSLTVHPITFQ